METTREKYYQGLYELATVMNSANSPEIVLHSFVHKVAQIAKVKGCALMLLTPDERLIHVAACGLSEWYLKKGPVLARNSISEALEQKPIAVFDATSDERIQYRRLAKKEGIASILSVPMMLREEDIGVIRVYSGEPRQFNEDDIYFVGVAANLGAIALENTVLYEWAEHDYHMLRKKMRDWLSLLGTDWIVWEELTSTQA